MLIKQAFLHTYEGQCVLLKPQQLYESKLSRVEIHTAHSL